MTTELNFGTATLTSSRPSTDNDEIVRVVEAPAATNPGAEGPAADFPRAWLGVFRDAVQESGLPWIEPHVAGSDEEVTFEWWKDSRNLTVFVRGYHLEVLKVWGANIHDEMETVAVTTKDAVVALWRWLNDRER